VKETPTGAVKETTTGWVKETPTGGADGRSSAGRALLGATG
jgi:hypothetical protein